MKRITASEEALTGVDEPPKQKKKPMAEEANETVTAALRTELETLRAENKTLKDSIETQRVESVNREADAIIEAAVRDGKIAPKNETVKASLKKWFVTDPAGAKAHIESLPTNPAFKTVVQVTGAHRDVGKPAPVSTSNGDSGKQCKRRVEEVKAEYKGVTNERAWEIAAARWPDEFQKVEA
jgi:hypothetical protein